MSEKSGWDDESREHLRENLRFRILGEVRLYKRDPKEILDGFREFPIQEDAPEAEWDTFLRFASDEMKKVADTLAAEMAEWPAVTDCDRLDRAEDALRERGILLW